MLQTSDLTFSYNEHTTFRFPDIQCREGEHLLILGQSGKGKTTLLHLLAGFLLPGSGRILINETDIGRLPPAGRDHFRGRTIGIVFQRAYFVSALNVQDNLLLAQYLAGEAQDKSRIRQLLTRLNMDHKLLQKPYRLSQGEQQRVGIARAMLNRPKVILADEPTSALDDLHCQEVIHLLKEQAAEAGASLIIVTHDQRLKEAFQHQIVLN
ncbi:MAG: ATP-binding cassette domain-containing protein [Bacteroidetes bacterium]|nr:MAG: ATP-binding cassette domain-containing protein [Bacteroidota bacterium]